jgi:hypothetical protein
VRNRLKSSNVKMEIEKEGGEICKRENKNRGRKNKIKRKPKFQKGSL